MYRGWFRSHNPFTGPLTAGPCGFAHVSVKTPRILGSNMLFKATKTTVVQYPFRQGLGQPPQVLIVTLYDSAICAVARSLFPPLCAVQFILLHQCLLSLNTVRKSSLYGTTNEIWSTYCI